MWLESTHSLDLYALLHAGLERSFFYQLHRLSEELRELEFDTRHVKQRYPTRFIESRQQIDIRIRVAIAAHSGTEY